MKIPKKKYYQTTVSFKHHRKSVILKFQQSCCDLDFAEDQEQWFVAETQELGGEDFEPFKVTNEHLILKERLKKHSCAKKYLQWKNKFRPTDKREKVHGNLTEN